MTIPPILCVIGPSDSGKTRLLTRLIRDLGERGLRVAAVKHCGHIDRSEVVRDSHRLADAGAAPVVAAAPDAVEVCGALGEPLLLDLVATHCRECDLVLVEGYRRSVHEKILVGPPAEAEGIRLAVSPADASSGDCASCWPIDSAR